MLDAIQVSSPIGALAVYAHKGAIVSLQWDQDIEPNPTPLLAEAQAQLGAYFDHRLEAFDLPLRVSGSAFQKAVCHEMLRIPYGETRTYGDIAKSLSTSAQPVGGACGRNPIPILIPCHRVLGENDKMVGFSGGQGIDTKRALLRLEGWIPEEPDLFSER